ncbi:thermonuclease family protein [Roseomonas sp. 573]|uniref:Thermonuclease family protein n=1 Tax=Roseomonas haemaphysalidis TaxID=2768162 RepID=A0ABS3KVZ4_9PROT|nr:thermonuclease family protein [Roseomonas haemaphysalidis]
MGLSRLAGLSTALSRAWGHAELVRGGHAWVYRQYMTDRSLLPLEAEARAARRGLWSLPERERIPPWAWRRQQRRR